jgi:hypothetical protein
VRVHSYCFAALALIIALGATPRANAQPARGCSGAPYHQFDFWAGDWVVHNRSDGKLEGTNVVTHELSGCVLQEHWVGASGDRGTSFNLYDGTTRSWHQTWVDNSGSLLILNGSLRDGSMTLSGSTVGRKGRTLLHKIVWTPLADKTVRQHWISSRDGGKTWTDVFDGIYSKRRL